MLRAEARRGHTEELCLAAALVGLHGQAEDHELVQSLRTADPDVHYGLGGFPAAAPDLSAWAAELDESNHGQDPADEDELTWADLARRQGRTELARSILVRLLDDTGPRDALRLGCLAARLAQLGDFAQAVRARQLHACLQDDPHQRGVSMLSLASLQRRAGDVDVAWQSLQRAVADLDGPPPAPPTDQLALELGLPEQENRTVAWRALGLGQRVAEEHFLIARAAATSARSATAHAALAAGASLLDTLPRPADNLRLLATEVAEELAAREVGDQG
ncbi:hypothetical protein [Kitasatospora herbaricolor]|uniref:Tetratricopeptide repeat protein n=1 Tax=Kitasatospora herbaricolor TaxID=68217 RepID=A0ABZ1W1F1_9ACTN|nr:hypothetical protein [Kitasatospora herbaricolor]